jgi:hypothetical protein
MPLSILLIPSRRSPRFAWVLLLLSVAALAEAAGPADAVGPSFSREIRPILSDRCFRCHGPDENHRKGGLRLDLPDEASRELKSGRRAIVPGRVDQSHLVARLFSEDPDEVMPPPETKKPLTSEQKDLLKRWVASGARYEQHWAFQPPRAPAMPAVRDSGWVRNGIDSFILARLESEGLSPSPPADKSALARRVSLDLIGLPPTAEELSAFLADSSPQAYESLVDRLLRSPHYGERWARPWLDLARYADTNGYEKDRARSIWPYRDWVIHALNRDLPFDQFTVEQLAGDLLPDPTVDQRVATGFHRNTMRNEEGGIDPLEFRFHAMNDRVATTGTTWLGLTLQCAQCHTHKYDPIPHREYYQVMACLNNADEPDLDLPDQKLEATWRQNQEEAARRLAALADKWPLDVIRWETPRDGSAQDESKRPARLLEDGSFLFEGKPEERDVYTLRFSSSARGVDQLRLEALTDPSLPSKGPGRTPHGNFVLSEIQVFAAPLSDASAALRPLKIVSATADVEQPGFLISAAVDGDEATGWAVHDPRKTLNSAKVAHFSFEAPVGHEGGTRYEVRLVQRYGGSHLMGRLRVGLGIPSADTRAVAVRRQEAMQQSFQNWLTRERRLLVDWRPVRPVELRSNLPILSLEPDGSIFVSGDITKHDTYELALRDLPPRVTAVRLEVLPDDRLPAHGPGMTYYEGPPGDFFLSELELLASGQPCKISKASHSYAKTGLGADNVGAQRAIDGDLQTGWSCAGRMGERHQAVFVLEAPLEPAGDLRVKMQFWRHYAASLGRFRLSVTADPRGAEARDLPEEMERLLRKPSEELTSAERQELLNQFLLSSPELANEAEQIRRLRRRPSATTTLVMRERPAGHPRPTFVHHRGEYLQPKEAVEPGVLSILNPLPSGSTRDRLGLARWLVSPENPLTARVVMNRNWALVFGTGLVKTVQDFGFQGDLPSHPELLDWLALEFIRQGWSVKAMHRLMVTSATYRQTSHRTELAGQRDPENRLLSHGPRKRLDAEMVRDAALRASGLLQPTIGGPSVYPPQPAAVTSEGTYGAMGWTASTGPDRYRRGLYVFAKRTAPFAMFNTFDGPSGEACVARRERSNTPLQALTLLNDQVFVEIAQAFGALLVKSGGTDQSRIESLFERSLSRRPTDREVQALLRFAEVQRGRIQRGEMDSRSVAGAGEGDVGERAVWTLLARLVFNLDEFITQG